MRLSAERSDGASVFAFCLLNGIVITGRRLACCWALLFKMEGVSNRVGEVSLGEIVLALRKPNGRAAFGAGSPLVDAQQT